MSPTPLQCVVCGADMPAAERPGLGRLYCSNACRQRAYRQRARDPGEATGAADAAGPDSRNGAADLPLALDNFVGRKQELTSIARLLKHGRLITLLGPAGVGKTRLALEVAAHTRPAFPAGVHLVELGPLRRPDLVAQAVAAAAGVTEQPGTPLVETLVDSLREKRLLLVLDNCEHLVEACGTLAVALLRGCPGLHVLATSRETLRLPGELVFPAGELPPADAVLLFAERARGVSPTFALTRQSRPVVEAICRRLDNLPLAVELAARLVRLLPVDDILDRLEDRFALLTSGTRTAETRHRDLSAAIEWSYDLLDQAEQALFRRLSVLPGGFDVDLAAAVSTDLELPVIETLASLESKSLLTAVTATGGRARFRQLESVRCYAQRQLVECGEADTATEQLVAALTGLATPLAERFDW